MLQAALPLARPFPAGTLDDIIGEDRAVVIGMERGAMLADVKESSRNRDHQALLDNDVEVGELELTSPDKFHVFYAGSRDEDTGERDKFCSAEYFLVNATYAQLEAAADVAAAANGGEKR